MNKGIFNLLKADLKFLKGCLALINELAVFEKSTNEVQVSLENFTQDFLAKKFEAWIATSDNEVVGLALYYPIYSTWKGPSIHLEDLIVQEKYRRCGLGKLLFEKVVETAKEQNVGRLQWQVLNWNTKAIAFYNQYPVSYEADWLTAKISKEALSKL